MNRVSSQSYQQRPHSKILFDTNQITRIQKRFHQFAKGGLMNIEMFKKSMGLLGIGECQFLCDRIFPLITQFQTFDCDEFLSFLNTITYGSKARKAKISFDFLDKGRKGYINYNDIQIVISEMSFIWNFLTGQKIPNSDSIALICQILGIRQDRSISFEQYIEVYDNYIEWYEYFNNQIKPPNLKKQTLNLDQIQEYLKLLYFEIEGMIEELRETEETQEETKMIHSFSELSEIANNVRGPTYSSFQQIKPKGDFDNPRQSLVFYRASTLSRDIVSEGSSKIEIITKKLEQFSKISQKLFPQYHNEPTFNSIPQTSRGKKTIITNLPEPNKGKKKVIYFGHENWNIMLNMMLGIRKSLKSHFYKFDSSIEFTEEDINCKYAHQLIYKQNNKSVKEISQIFVDYAPKCFFYIRCVFKMDNNQFLKSIGLESLLGNFLMGNLTTLTDQTSQGKNGSFFYYTQDTKLIMKSISKDQYLKLRQILSDYVNYIKDNPETFLLHIYGLYKLKNKQTNRQIYFIVVNNFFETSLKIEQKYDIKGYAQKRQAKNNESNTALKDLDLMNNKNRNFLIHKDIKQKIYKQIIKDSQFLAQHDLTQYSLLIGISKNNGEKSNVASKGFVSLDHKETFYFGIIDILSQYSIKKSFENGFFNIFTAEKPNEYNSRFKSFIYKYVFGS